MRARKTQRRQVGGWNVTKAMEMWRDGCTAAQVAREVGVSEAAVAKRVAREKWPRLHDVAKAQHGDNEATARLVAGELAERDARRAEAWRRRMVLAHMRVADAVEMMPVPGDAAELEQHQRVMGKHVDIGFKLFGLDRQPAAAGQTVNVNIGLLGRLPPPSVTVDTGKPGEGAEKAPPQGNA